MSAPKYAVCVLDSDLVLRAPDVFSKSSVAAEEVRSHLNDFAMEVYFQLDSQFVFAAVGLFDHILILLS